MQQVNSPALSYMTEDSTEGQGDLVIVSRGMELDKLNKTKEPKLVKRVSGTECKIKRIGRYLIATSNSDPRPTRIVLFLDRSLASFAP